MNWLIIRNEPINENLENEDEDKNDMIKTNNDENINNNKNK